MLMNTQRGILLTTAMGLYALVVFILDIVTPVGIEVWVLNLPLILVPVVVRSGALVILLTLACCAMQVAGSVFSPPGPNPLSWDLMNRGMGIATLWMTALLALHIIKRSQQLDSALSSLRREKQDHDLTGLALQQSEERLRLATEGAGMGTFDMNLLTNQVLWSATHSSMHGFEPVSGRITTIKLWESLIHPEDLQRVLEARELAMRQHSVYGIEHRIRRADDGEMIWLAVFGRFYYDDTGRATRFLGVSFDVTRQKELEREVLEIAAREQRQIGQELHDSVGQELTGLGLMAQSLVQRIPDSMQEKKIALRLLAGLDNLHSEVRELSRGLIPVHLESRGLAAALDELATRTTEASGIPVSADCPAWVELPDHLTGTQLFRIAQEAVTNAVRHGGPRHIGVSLDSGPNGLQLRIKDDGIGFQGDADAKGLGLRIMQYRAGVVGGVLQIQASHGGGTVVTCTLPRRKGNGSGESGSGHDSDENHNRG